MENVFRSNRFTTDPRLRKGEIFGIYGLMASSSGFVIPLTIFFIGTRLWALGKKFGHQTQVQFFRDRWECDSIGTLIFALSAAMLVPYMIISIMGGGTVAFQIAPRTGPDSARRQRAKAQLEPYSSSSTTSVAGRSSPGSSS